MDLVQEIGIQEHPRIFKADIHYGTAGFRDNAAVLDHVMYRMGALAALRSKLKNAAIGVMITASHNPEEDNGLKLVDPEGEMLEQSWESLATSLVNAEDSQVDQVLNNIAESNNVPMDKEGIVFVGRDTRKSSVSLCQAVIDGAQAAGASVNDFEVVSTPQLHYFVACHNTGEAYGKASEQGYYDKLASAFAEFRASQTFSSKGNYRPNIHFDGANGVGALKMKSLMEIVEQKAPGSLVVNVVNDGSNEGDILNFNCGADFVKVNQRLPKSLESMGNLERGVSVDGDADRVVYFFKDSQGVFKLMDGDKIATLVVGYLKEVLSASGLNHLLLGLVQTAYANGSSTKYATEQLRVAVACVPTGVKHLHHKALDFDVGVYFEANGHGTVTFSDKAEAEVRKLANSGNKAANRILTLMNLINQTVGDAISDMLLVECILCVKGWDVVQWSQEYQDLPNRLLKVKVADRKVIQTADAERKCVKPDGLQAAIDVLTSVHPDFRAFVRPSGTEDVVRVYAEADTKGNADSLAYEVGLNVYQLAGGVGEPSPKPV